MRTAVPPTLRGDDDGTCGVAYGGTVVTPEQVILTRTIDPAVGTSTCDPGSSKVQAFELDADASNNFVVDFTLSVSSAVMGGLYGDAGAIYFATLSGDALSAVNTAQPSIPGIITSRSTSAGRTSSSFVRAVRPSDAETTR